MKKILFLFLSVIFCSNVHAAIQEEFITYQQKNQALEGYVVYDDAVKGPRPGILVVHDWKGFGEYSRRRARMLAELGYTAMAVDIYGKGIRPKDNQEAAVQAGIYKNDRGLMRARIQSAYDVLSRNPQVDAQKMGAIGYCFGGTVVLELARSGTNLAGVVSFHGGLATPTPEDAKNIKGKILVLHGGDDPFVPADEVAAFKKEMQEAQVDWQLTVYPGAVHSFTNPEAGDDKSKGAAYNLEADRLSWEKMKEFFAGIFK